MTLPPNLGGSKVRVSALGCLTPIPQFPRVSVPSLPTLAGNPQILGQKPVTFFRQVLSIIDYPELLTSPHVADIYPADVIARAKEYLARIPGGSGAYSESKGASVCREQVAAGIAARDGFPCDTDDLWLTDGASNGVHYLMTVLLRDDNDAILTPIPQYPLYSATIALYGGALVPYYLDEAAGWAARMEHLQAQVDGARGEGKTVRAIAVINPGNPTGQVLDRSNQEDLIRFCQAQGLLLIADEVYQKNIYAAGKQFFSFKRVLREMGPAFDDVLLVSLNSISKGFFGECGRRGGYMECVNFPADIKAQLYKLASISLCPNVNGQICTAMMMMPPKVGDPSYAQYAAERDGILASLKRRAALVAETLNGLEGVSCNEVEGALYAFPKLTLPPAAVDEAEKEGKKADNTYCMQLLDDTGIVTVPGSGFGQEEGTFHLRTTILPQESDMEKVAQLLTNFHSKYMAKYK
jgi:alanine transaminase